ncbi:DUF6898 family protein [Oryzibacter oryziterrae]|uniref:DUF6898 family protein n=1 Tax=Oryzibacter oryziterrae TaxID=2766474 RepID=UPI001F35A477|nr:serine hydroxymethyltransferase [Oryzibacter oryziterrae]
MSGQGAGREIYFEFTVIGRQVRVAAVCSVTGLEAVILGPATTPRHDLQRLALRKLEQRLVAEKPAPLPGRGGEGYV